MPVTVLIPSPLRPLAGGRDRAPVTPEPATVGGVLEALWAQHPLLRPDEGVIVRMR